MFGKIALGIVLAIAVVRAADSPTTKPSDMPLDPAVITDAVAQAAEHRADGEYPAALESKFPGRSIERTARLVIWHALRVEDAYNHFVDPKVPDAPARQAMNELNRRRPAALSQMRSAQDNYPELDPQLSRFYADIAAATGSDRPRAAALYYRSILNGTGANREYARLGWCYDFMASNARNAGRDPVAILSSEFLIPTGAAGITPDDVTSWKVASNLLKDKQRRREFLTSMDGPVQYARRVLDQKLAEEDGDHSRREAQLHRVRTN